MSRFLRDATPLYEQILSVAAKHDRRYPGAFLDAEYLADVLCVSRHLLELELDRLRQRGALQMEGFRYRLPRFIPKAQAQTEFLALTDEA